MISWGEVAVADLNLFVFDGLAFASDKTSALAFPLPFPSVNFTACSARSVALVVFAAFCSAASSASSLALLES